MTAYAGVFVKWLAALFVRPQTTGSWALQIDGDIFVSNHLTNTNVGCCADLKLKIMLWKREI